MPVVYADVVWLVNAIMDAVILLTSCWVLKAPVRWWRICSGGVFGACYALLLFVPSLSTLTTWPGKAVAELIMVAVAIPARNWLQLIRACVTYYLVAFVFAGAAIALHFAVPGTSVAAGSWSASRHLEYSTSLEGLALLVALPTGYGLLRFTLRRADRVLQTTTSLRSVRATFANHQVQFTGLVDTGNQLRDPLSRRPVCLVDATVMRQLLPPALAEALTEADDVVRALEHCASLPHAERLALVPYRGAGGEQRLALAVRPDALEIEVNGALQRVTTPCLLAVHPQPLSGEGRFQAILHIEVVTGVDRRDEGTVAETVEHETADTTATAVDPDSHQAGWRS